ncbi:hypothetical protein [Pseudoalteromonas tunicata]|uniref:hypothetical protein n=1 Tax=Pseudoalteromonas tunicata TaxID=314281 RepID=UPI00273E4243|nr:hypothetical protein [Pseudoalteromonas tunicata]MDP4982642.1 hypothetical protein [Pseudoalteromonas tunicata]MDP5213275.1 hypothetical protein [Pseudoalteromonas tunicata]
MTDFSQLNKSSAKSFNEQKATIKKLMQGREMKCPHCLKAIVLYLPEQSANPGARCAKGCTDIALDFV